MSKHTVQDENSSSSSSNTLIIDLEEKIDDEVPRKKARYDFFTKKPKRLQIKQKFAFTAIKIIDSLENELVVSFFIDNQKFRVVTLKNVF